MIATRAAAVNVFPSGGRPTAVKVHSRSMTGLRSAGWYAGQDRNAYIHRAWMRRGLPGSAFAGRPQIAIANTDSDLTPCNSHLNEVAEHVKRGIWEAGGVPLNLPVVSLGETLLRPTAMLWRNMAAMAAEEMFRGNPVDGLVLLGGCHKTIPALLMAAASVDLPAVVVPGGPMLTGTFRGVPLGCGTDVWRLSEEVRAGTLSREAFLESESSMIRSRGHCNTMSGVVDDPLTRALQHHGDGVHHGAARRGAGHDPDGDRRAAGAGQPAAQPVARERSARGRAGRRGAASQRGDDPGRVRQRDRGARGARWVDERRGAPAGDRRPARRRPDAGGLRPDRAPGAAARRPAAGGAVPHGGLPPGRGPARRAARDPLAARPLGGRRGRPSARRPSRRRAHLGRRGAAPAGEPAEGE